VPKVQVIINVATSPKDLEVLRPEMGKLRERVDELAALFASEPDTQKQILAIGQLGGGAVSPAPCVPMQLFAKLTEATEALNRVLAKMQVEHTTGSGIQEVAGPLSPVPTSKIVQPVTLPPGTEWEELTIKFVNGENVKIAAKGKTLGSYNCKELGFEDGRRHKPNKQWELLYLLSRSGGELNWSQAAAHPSAKKIKERLSKALKAVFPIDQDPFRSYKKFKAYKIKVKLIPD
jgi:hypothetical protein